MAPKTLKAKKVPGWLGYSKHVTDTSSDSPGNNNLAAGKYYGTGVRAKLGRLRDGTMLPGNPVKKSELKIPPKSIV